MNILDMYKGAEELDLGAEEGAGGAAADAVADAVRAEIAEVAVVIEEQSQQIETLANQVGELDETVEELADNVEGLEHLLSSGNFNGTSFALLYGKSVKLANKLGADIQGDRMGAESFSDAASAQMMARSGMESFVDTVKEYGRKAIEFIKHIYNVVINFFISLFNQADAIQRRCDQLKKRLDGAAAVKEKIKLGNWNVYFNYEKNGLTDAKNGTDWDATTAALASLMDLGKNVQGVDLASVNSAYAAVVSAIKSDAKKATKTSEKKQGTSDVVISVANGLRVLASYSDVTPKDLSEAAAAIRSVKIQFGKDPEAKKLTTGEVKAKLKKAELLSVVSDVRSSVAELRALDVAKKFSAAERDRVIGSLNAIKAGDSEKTTEINKQLAVVRAIFSVSANLSQAISKTMANGLRASLDGVQAHIGY